MLRDSVAVVVVRTRPRAKPLAVITMRKSTHGLPFLSHMGMGLRLTTVRADGAALKNEQQCLKSDKAHAASFLNSFKNVCGRSTNM